MAQILGDILLALVVVGALWMEYGRPWLRARRIRQIRDMRRALRVGLALERERRHTRGGTPVGRLVRQGRPAEPVFRRPAEIADPSRQPQVGRWR